MHIPSAMGAFPEKSALPYHKKKKSQEFTPSLHLSQGCPAPCIPVALLLYKGITGVFDPLHWHLKASETFGKPRISFPYCHLPQTLADLHPCHTAELHCKSYPNAEQLPSGKKKNSLHSFTLRTNLAGMVTKGMPKTKAQPSSLLLAFLFC